MKAPPPPLPTPGHPLVCWTWGVACFKKNDKMVQTRVRTIETDNRRNSDEARALHQRAVHRCAQARRVSTPNTEPGGEKAGPPVGTERVGLTPLGSRLPGQTPGMMVPVPVSTAAFLSETHPWERLTPAAHLRAPSALPVPGCRAKVLSSRPPALCPDPQSSQAPKPSSAHVAPAPRP